jgi:hypothetical protein
MIKGIGFQKVDLTQLEFDYYQKLVKQHSDDKHSGEEYFRDLFDTDNNGFITIIHPTKSIPWAILFFVQNLMINQQMRVNDKRLSAIEKAIGVKNG